MAIVQGDKGKGVPGDIGATPDGVGTNNLSVADLAGEDLLRDIAQSLRRLVAAAVIQFDLDVAELDAVDSDDLN